MTLARMFSLSGDVLFLCNDTGTLIRILCQNESLTLSGEERVLIVKTETEFVERDTVSAPNPTPSTTAMRPSTSYSNAFSPAAHPYPTITNTFPASANSFPGTANPFNTNTPLLSIPRRSFPPSGTPVPPLRQRNTPISKGILSQVSTGCYYRQKGVLKFRPMAGGAVYNITILRGDRVSDAIRKISTKAGNAVDITTHCLCYRNGVQLTEDNEFCLADILTRVIGRKPQVYVAARPENEDDFDDNSYENTYETPLSDIPNGTRIAAETQTCNVLLEGLIENIFKCPLCTIAQCTKMCLVCGHAVCTECLERISPVQDEDEEDENPHEDVMSVLPSKTFRSGSRIHPALEYLTFRIEIFCFRQNRSRAVNLKYQLFYG
ncbi:hypothetical protein Y032_0131g1673 [Ancylostoma ceylanicum]|uniref:RING-type domain-containing protein n=1 Tax=Ancylostoma ceylanicum TaxID=53326 RepID=A0A016T799_9BILA|nr:hypothetical protein Y032_0131g1673 [Ancylostoma ceylanicum]